MQIRLITLISTQKVLKTLNKQGSKYHFLNTNQDFPIELHPGTSLISMTPHRMAPTELQELKV